MTPTPTVSAKEKARGAQERTAFEQWAANEWQNSSPPDNAWKGWIARAQVANRAALSATEGEAEPVAWRWREKGRADWNAVAGHLPVKDNGDWDIQPLYASPPSAPAGVKELISDLAAVVRVQNGNLHADINALLARAEAALSSLQPDTQAAAASAPAGDIQELASASVRPEPSEVEDGKKARLHCKSCTARFFTEWERVEHERDYHAPNQVRPNDATDLRAAARAVTDATRAYLPPDGISKDELINRVLAATDNPEINAVMLGGRNGAP